MAVAAGSAVLMPPEGRSQDNDLIYQARKDGLYYEGIHFQEQGAPEMVQLRSGVCGSISGSLPDRIQLQFKLDAPDRLSLQVVEARPPFHGYRLDRYAPDKQWPAGSVQTIEWDSNLVLAPPNGTPVTSSLDGLSYLLRRDGASNQRNIESIIPVAVCADYENSVKQGYGFCVFCYDPVKNIETRLTTVDGRRIGTLSAPREALPLQCFEVRAVPVVPEGLLNLTISLQRQWDNKHYAMEIHFFHAG
jgi:hypothetical protein